MHMKTALAAIGLFAAPTVAHAQDSAAFQGPYVGVIAGYDHVILSDGGISESKDGLSYGGILGYDFRMGEGVVGIEGEVAGSTTKQTVNDVLVAGDSASLKAGRDLYIGVRGGLLVTPEALLYVKGGYANARATGTYTSPTASGSVSDNIDGFRVGAGAEYAFGKFRARLEYRYSDYSQIKYLGTPTGVDAKRHQVMVGVIAGF